MKLTDSPAIYVGSTPATVRLGGTVIWPPTSGLDSFRTLEDVGPTSTNKQGWGGAFTQGVVFTPQQEVLLHGARWWRVGWEDEPGHAVPTPSSTLVRFHVALAAGGSPSLAQADMPVGATPELSGWTSVDFPAPVRLAPGVAYCVFVQAEHTFEIGGADYVPVAREPSGLASATSRLGLLVTPSVEGRFNAAGSQTVTPDSTVDAWYWIDPQAEGVDVPEPRVISGSTVAWADPGAPAICPVPPNTIGSDTVVLFTKVEGTPTDPAGWTLHGTSTEGGGVVSTYTRTGLTAGTDITIPPGSAWSNGVSMLTVRGATAIAYTDTVADDNHSGDNVDWPGTSVTADGTLLVLCPWQSFRTVAAAEGFLPGVYTIPGAAVFHDHRDAGPTGVVTLTNATGGSSFLRVIALQIT